MLNNKSHCLLILAVTLLSSKAAVATSCYGFNSAVLISDEHGRCYVKSVPAKGYGSAGTTRVFRVGAKKGILQHRFNWYSPSLAIKCGNIGPKRDISISVVRMGGSWSSEGGEIAGPVTLAFYLDGRLLAEYSGMDIAVLPDNADNRRDISHPGYTKVLGFRRVGRRDGFEICTQDGRILLFDISNGDLVDESRDSLKLCER